MSKLKIMVVEDEAIAALDLKKRLRFWGYEVPATVSSGAEAIHKARELNPDLVLMDIILKGDMDGIEVAQQLLEELDLQVIYLTAHSEENTMERAKLTQPYGYLVKPVGDKELKFAVDVALYKHKMDQKLNQANRALRMLSECNQMVIRIKDKNKLLNEICRIIVEHGGYSLAWVARKQHDAAKSILPVAQHGYDEGYLESLNITWADTKHGQSPVGQTLRTSKLSMTPDILQDPKLTTWLKSAQERGYNSYLSLPLIIGENVWGALNIYSSQVDAFNQEEVELLVELADDISYAIDSIKSRDELEDTLKALKTSEEKYRNIFENAMEGIYQSTPEGTYISVNPAFAHMGGFKSPEEMIENVQDISQLYVNPQDREEIKRRLREVGVIKNFVTELYHQDGHKIWISIYSKAVKDENGNIIYYEGTTKDITEQKEMEDALRESEEKYRTMVETANEGVWAIDANFKTTFVNHKMAEMLGYQSEEMIGKPVDSFMVEEELEDHEEQMKIRKKGINQRYQRRFKHKDGSEVWGIVSANTILDSDGRFAGSFAMLTDITDIRNAEIALKKSEERFRAVAESAIDAIITTDVKGRILFFNRSVEHIFGFSSAEISGKPLTILMPERFKNDYLEEMERFKSSGKHRLIGKIVTTTGLRKNGKEFPFEMSLSAWKSRDQTYFTSIIRDLSDRAKTEKSLKKSEEKYHSLYSAMSEGVAIHKVLYDENGIAADYEISDINPAFESITGLKKSEIEGKKASEIYGTGKPPYLDTYVKVAETGEPTSFDTVFQPMGKNFEISAFSPRKNMFVTVFEDITQRKIDEEKIKKSLKEKELLLSEIHHRVKNNLQVISSLLSLQSRYIEDENTRDIFLESQSRVKSMAVIHESLYDSEDFSRINFSVYLRSLSIGLFSSYKVDTNIIRLQINMEDIYYDINTSIPLGLIINELLTNSIKHAFPGGRKGIVTISIYKKENKSNMVFADDGVGFPDDIDFENTDTLGLQLVQSLVTQLNGTLTLDRGVGTKFTLQFRDVEYADRF